jgi:preprotein translocase subunit Sec61beta
MGTRFKPDFIAYAGVAFALVFVQWLGIELTPERLITYGLVAAVLGIIQDILRP